MRTSVVTILSEPYITPCTIYKIVSLVLDYFNIKGGRLALIISVSEVDYNSSTNIETRTNFVRNTPSFSPIYSTMYKVWEGMAKDNIITQVM